MAALAGYAWLVAAAPARPPRRRSPRWPRLACVVAALALAEALGLRALDPLLDRVPRDAVQRRRHRAARSALPSTRTWRRRSCIYGLVASAGLLSSRRGGRRLRGRPSPRCWAPGLLVTYSRGALVARRAAGCWRLVAVAGPARAARRAAPRSRPSACWACARRRSRGRARSSGCGSPARVRAAWYARATTSRPRRAAPARRASCARRRCASRTPGARPGPRATSFHLSYHWCEPGPAAAGGRRAHAPARATSGPGRERAAGGAACARRDSRAGYLLVWDMVHEHTTWFSGQGVAPRSGAGACQRAAGAAHAPDAVLRHVAVRRVGWQPGRWELWRLALGMWRERPLTGVGPDNFRWLYGPACRPRRSGTRGCSRTTCYLETAATTGTLGLVALCGTLATQRSRERARGLAGARRRRRWPRPPAALVAAIAAHGAGGLPARVHRALPGARDRRGDVRGCRRAGAKP